MFSVIIPLYNKQLSITNTVESVLSQTYQNFEIIVVNDGSTDNSRKVVEKISDPRIRLIDQVNQGVSAARNRGIKEAKNEWIALLDGDDIWRTDHLEEIVKMMDELPPSSKRKVYVTSFDYSNKPSLRPNANNFKSYEVNNYFKAARCKTIICSSIVVIHKACFNSIGMFKENLNRGEDLDLWARLAKEYKIVKSPKVTATYRIEAENRSTSSFNIEKSFLYNHDFSSASSVDEAEYYQARLSSSIRGYILEGRYKDCLRLVCKHYKHISPLDLFKIKPL